MVLYSLCLKLLDSRIFFFLKTNSVETHLHQYSSLVLKGDFLPSNLFRSCNLLFALLMSVINDYKFVLD